MRYSINLPALTRICKTDPADRIEIYKDAKAMYLNL